MCFDTIETNPNLNKLSQCSLGQKFVLGGRFVDIFFHLFYFTYASTKFCFECEVQASDPRIAFAMNLR